jgi:hypothetical protein
MDTQVESTLARVLDPLTLCLIRPVVWWIAGLRTDPEIEARLEQLAEKAKQGALSTEERTEYEAGFWASRCLAYIQAKAREMLPAPMPGADVPESTLTIEQLRQLNDLNWASYAPEVQQHEGKLVAVRNRRVLAVGTDSPTLAREAAAKAGCQEKEVTIVFAPDSWLREASSY